MGAFSISLLVHGLFALVAALFLYKWVYPPEPELVSTGPVGGTRGGEATTKVKTQSHPTIPVSLSNDHRIKTDRPASFSLPEASSDLADAALPMPLSVLGGEAGTKMPGDGHGLNAPGVGNKPGSGFRPGGGEGFMTPFGTNVAVQGSMPGRFYDFKQTRDGKPTEGYQVTRYGDFTSRVSKLQDSGFRELAFRKFFQAPDTLYLTQIAIPLTNANSGPTFFNVADKVKPSGWFVHYQGDVSADRDIIFRFVGTGDDYVSVFVKGLPRMIAAWPSLRAGVSGRWVPSEPIDENAATPLPGGPLVKGDWIKLKKGEKLDLDIGIGECPGGKVGFVLMVEEKGVKYRTAPNGAPVLPLFTTQPITKSSRDRITKDFQNWEFEWEKVPVFSVDQTSGMESDFH